MSTSTRGAKRRSHWNLPNALTWLRILMIPAIVALFYLLAVPVGGSGGLRRFCAGRHHRYAWTAITRASWAKPRASAHSWIPVADKLIVAAALVLIVSKDPRWFVVIVAMVIIGREIAVSALREWMAEIGARSRIKVSLLAKYKTIMQIVGLSLHAVPAEPVRHCRSTSSAWY